LEGGGALRVRAELRRLGRGVVDLVGSGALYVVKKILLKDVRIWVLISCISKRDNLGVAKMVVVERDYAIMREVERWRYCLSRHIKILGGFDGQRTCDRRMKILIEAGYIDRRKILYGVPSIYYLPYKGKMLIGANKRQDKIRVEKIPHDILVVDTAIYFMLKHGIKTDEIMTEKQINSKSGFGERKHSPDFIMEREGKKHCVEVELTQKAKGRFEKIVEENYIEYETQIWIVSKTSIKIKQMLGKLSEKYGNIKIITLEGVQEYVRENH
jgi:hypothetical protein